MSLSLNQPDNLNPGNIGAEVTSSKDLGAVFISRGYVFARGLPAKAVQRYYSINFADPSKDADLDATLRFHYFDGELNTADETKLVPWKYDFTGRTWVEQNPPGNITRSASGNWVQLVGINSLGTRTLAEATGAVPVIFSIFNVICKNNNSLINWQTASESNLHNYEVQKSVDGSAWVTIAVKEAAGQSNTLKNYQHTDELVAPSARVYYRIKSVDNDGKESFTAVNSTTCSIGGNWQVWPNPVKQRLNISLKLGDDYKIAIRFMDNKGILLRKWNKTSSSGNSQFLLDIGNIPKGVYHLILSWDEGRGYRSEKIIKE